MGILRAAAVILSTLLLSLATLWSRGAADAPLEIWRDEAKGLSRHLQSGLACPLNLVNEIEGVFGNPKGLITLGTLVVGESAENTGDQVACEYEGSDSAWATVEIRKLKQGEDVSDVASEAREKIRTQYADARRTNTYFNCKPENVPGARDTYCASFDQVGFKQQMGVIALLAGEVDGWSITLIQYKSGSDYLGVETLGRVNWSRIARTKALKKQS